MQSLRARHRSVIGLMLLLVLVPVSAWAHGARLPFAQWGGFGSGAATCQRFIARAAAQCAETAWRARRACRSAVLAGNTCDEDATQEIISAARISALDSIDAHCSELEAIDLQFLGTFDLQEDVIRFCRSWEAAALSSVYGPFASTVPAEQRACAEAAADAADSVMHFFFRTRRQCMDRIAGLPLQAPNRSTLLDVTGHRMAGADDAVVARLTARCGQQQFQSLYGGRAPETFVAGLTARADCIGGALYIQDAVMCPAPVCGNWIVELPETCDDGNAIGGDACPSTCGLP